MQHLLAKVSRGQKTSKDLTWEEAKQAMRLMIEGTATPAQIGAFLTAMRFKSESVTELAAFTSTARQYVPPVPVRSDLAVVDVPTYAGKRETFHAIIPAAIVAAAAGAVILLHGVDGPPDRRGISSVLGLLGIPVDQTAKLVGAELEKKGLAYLDLALYHPPVSRFLEMRQELGLRNVFHPVARMLNPARATSQVIGLSHPPYFEKTIEALRMLSCPRALVIRGVEGDPELSIGNMTRLLELKEERITPFTFQPKDAGLTMATFREMAGFPAEQREREADLIKRLVANEIQGGQRDWVLLNAAMLLYAAGKGTSITGNLATAQRTLESGQAKAKLVELAAARGSGTGASQKVGIPA
ncbi:MAG: trpD [Nitrospira sp.]|jgi:anthranilate phosphoribosyltransferase|nr:trpD [Nitrospira sp.]